MDPKKEVISNLRACLYKHIGRAYNSKSKVVDLLAIESFLGEAADIILKERAKLKSSAPSESGEWRQDNEWPKEPEGQ